MYRKKTTVIIVMCVMMLFMGIGYALLSTKLDINGGTSVTSTWKVEFSAIRVKTGSTKGGATSKSSSYTSTTANFEVDLVQPGDELTYEIDITNYGDIKAEVKGATYTSTDNDAIYIRIENIRKGTTIESCEGLTTCPTHTMTVTVGYNPAVEKDPTSKTKEIGLTLNIGQYVASAPTADGELIPDAYEKLVTKILSNNTTMNDTNIEFTKISPTPLYKETHPTSTTSSTFSSTSNYYFANAYTFDTSTGYYSLAGDVVQGTWSSTMVQKYPYTCKSTSSANCTNFVYKITSYSSSTSGFGYNYMSAVSGYDAKANGQGLYYTSTNTEDNKVTYYFRGVVENNYVSFAEFIWRIVRINEDGTVRLIKQDSVGTSKFNENRDDNTYVGYMYGTAGATTYEETHANTNSSVMKLYLDIWYQNHLSNYSSYLADSGFCGDRTLYMGTGIGTTYSGYGVYNRLISHPQFKCPQDNDLYTTSTSTKGNKTLTYPIGLITADEASYAGGAYTEVNEKYYLYIGKQFWTMSPAYAGSPATTVMWTVGDSGRVGMGNVDDAHWVRPVINLKADTLILSGDGTKTNPYLVK